MSNRSAKFAAAMFASALAGANLATATQTRAQAAADDCLSGPKGVTPAGSHWYYRIDRGTKRQCWYLRDENDKATRAVPQDSSSAKAPSASPAAATPAATDPVPARPSTSARRSVSDARAEWPTPQTRVEQDSVSSIGAQTIRTPPAPAVQPSPAATAPDADASPSPVTPGSSSLVTSRWPDGSAANSFDNTRTASADPPPGAPANTKAKPRSATAPLALASVDSSIEKQSGSMQMLFLVMAGALMLAGITASLVFRFGRALQPRRDIRRDRRAIWDTVPAGSSSNTQRTPPSMRPSPSMAPGENLPMWRTADSPWRAGDSCDPRAPDDPQRRVTELLTRLARSAQT